ncbi:hypothetical protein C6499_07840 [Candidatus Poribacteria bacterium]|nr:MAG: hypothetical protein C6499_07840 [Candidatus Poribacteria bacterium]
MLKVAHILLWANYAGTERSIFNHCRFSQKTQPFVLVLSEGDVIRDFKKHGIPIYLTPGFPPGYGIVNEERAISLLKKADLINLRTVYYKDPLYRMFKKIGVPFVITINGFSKFPPLECPIICTSSAVREIQEPTNYCTTILNGVDLTMFAFRPKPCTEKIVLTRVCRPDRCASYFWPALQKVLNTTQNTELWIVGEEGESTDRIKFFGIRKHDEIPDILAKTDIFVYVPHPQKGTVDNSVLEAMAMGTPCVVSNVECIRDVVTHLKEGILVPYGDGEALVEGVTRLIENVSLRQKLGENGLQTAREKFDIVDVIRKYEEFYFSVL